MGILLYMVQVSVGNVPFSPNANQQCGHFNRLDIDLAELLEHLKSHSPGFDPSILSNLRGGR
jgi:hypothetical protein